ncbi:MAG: prepilin-type cleavage/methylation domain-containing protein [Methylotenera sp.]|uniref:type IV pilus modification PilV family protein n=1 Tax=Methylotenera sp. TaxID=2051956 RepID=UPI001856DA02|nr:prepilin-type cleavage/methylation domain-containing protein [Methylotenera sp.]NOU25342.1 prepilin-type cleavage/methylation domain-containing protein [Methylotenera sp.]
MISQSRQYLVAPKPIAKSQQGIVLLEALIAILLFSLGILALVGLQTAMVKNTSDSKYRADAAFIAQQKLGQVWVNAKNFASLADYAIVNEDISAVLPAGTTTVAVSAERVVTVTVRWQLPGEVQHNYSTNARIEGI